MKDFNTSSLQTRTRLGHERTKLLELSTVIIICTYSITVLHRLKPFGIFTTQYRQYFLSTIQCIEETCEPQKQQKEKCHYAEQPADKRNPAHKRGSQSCQHQPK